MSSKRRDVAYGRRGGAWADTPPGENLAELARLRAEREAREAEEARKAAERGDQLDLFDEGAGDA